jgi:hypothetical protein
VTSFVSESTEIATIAVFDRRTIELTPRVFEQTLVNVLRVLEDREVLSAVSGGAARSLAVLEAVRSTRRRATRSVNLVRGRLRLVELPMLQRLHLAQRDDDKRVDRHRTGSQAVDAVALRVPVIAAFEVFAR